MNTDDRRLIAECLRGRTSAFGDLVRLYQDRLYNSVYRIVDNAEDAQDVVQEAFIHAFQSLNSFKGDAEFFTWLYRIAFNAAISLKRRKKPVLSLEWSQDRDGTGIDPADQSEYTRPGNALERSEEEARLQRALQKLSPEYRAVLISKDIDGYRYEEIAEIMNVPIGTVRSRLHRARQELRDLLLADE